MRRCLVIIGLIGLCQNAAIADGRINATFDFNQHTLTSTLNDIGLEWQGIDIVFEKTFSKSNPVISGFAIGLRRELFYAFTGFGGRKDVDRWDEGTYLALRMYKSFELHPRGWSIGPAFSILYGIPGTTLDRTITSRYGSGNSYTHVFPVRNAGVPPFISDNVGLKADTALLYPEVAVMLSRQFAKGGIRLDWIGGVRIIRFGFVDSSPQGNVYSDSRVFIPTIGIRVGFRVF